MGGLVSSAGDHRCGGADGRRVPAAFEGVGTYYRIDYPGTGADGGVRSYVEHAERDPEVYAESRGGSDLGGIPGSDRGPARLVLRRGICTPLLPCALPDRGNPAGGVRRGRGVYCGRLALPRCWHIENGAGSDLL